MWVLLWAAGKTRGRIENLRLFKTISVAIQMVSSSEWWWTKKEGEVKKWKEKTNGLVCWWRFCWQWLCLRRFLEHGGSQPRRKSRRPMILCGKRPGFSWIRMWLRLWLCWEREMCLSRILVLIRERTRFIDMLILRLLLIQWTKNSVFLPSIFWRIRFPQRKESRLVLLVMTWLRLMGRIIRWSMRLTAM